MPFITFNGVGFAHNSNRPVFQNLSLSLPLGKVGIVGNNGCGKTTLLRLITGELQPQSGSIARQGLIYRMAQVFHHARSICLALGLGEYEAAYQHISQGITDEADFALLEKRWQIFDELQHILRQMHMPDADIFGAGSQLSHGQLQMLNLRYALRVANRFSVIGRTHQSSGQRVPEPIVVDAG